MKILIPIVLCLIVSCSGGGSNNENEFNWSFAVVADPRSNGDSFRNALKEIRDMKVNQAPNIDPAEFILVAGDIDPIVSRYNDYKEIFYNSKYMKSFFPVKGNHDQYDEIDQDYMVNTVIPEQRGITVRDNDYANYYVKWKNIYLIVVDGYSDLGSEGCINSEGLDWVENVIDSAPSTIDHIFISFHEPAFPRFRHLYDSFNACEEERDSFWNMLVDHRDKVRAVFVGHTHHYYRMRVFDPSGECAADTDCFPDDVNGIYQIDAGSAGNGEENTIVQVQINSKDLLFRVIYAENGIDKSFRLKDEWEVNYADDFVCNPNGDIEIPDDYSSIQEGINAADDGDTITVGPGIYNENIYLNGKNIILRSRYCCQGDQTCIERTVIDGGGQTVITVGSESNFSKIEGFTIQNGDDGIIVNSNISILGNYILNNNDGIDYESGGGICDGNIIKYNRDDGIDLDGPTEVTVSNNIISNNLDDGIEIRLHEYSGPVLHIDLRGNMIFDNFEDGIQLIDYPDLSDRIFRIERNLIVNNAMVGVGLMGDGNTVEDFSGAPILERIYLINNTFDGNNHGVTGGANLICLNNIFVSTQNSSLKNVSGDSIASYNLFWNNDTDYEDTNIDLANTLFTDPLLDLDYSLQTDSPAIDAGTAAFEWQGEIVLDIPEMFYLGSAPDLGAFEKK